MRIIRLVRSCAWRRHGRGRPCLAWPVQELPHLCCPQAAFRRAIYMHGSVLRSSAPSAWCGRWQTAVQVPPSTSRTFIFPSHSPARVASCQPPAPAALSEQGLPGARGLLPSLGTVSWASPSAGWASLPPQAGSTPGLEGTRLLTGRPVGWLRRWLVGILGNCVAVDFVTATVEIHTALSQQSYKYGTHGSLWWAGWPRLLQEAAGVGGPSTPRSLPPPPCQSPGNWDAEASKAP